MKLSDGAIKSLITATLCALWMYLSLLFNLIGWAGFAGCTAYFTYGKRNFSAVKHTTLAILSGSFYALASIYVCQKYTNTPLLLSLTFITTFLMCYGGRTKLLSFVPAAFLGSFSTFAAEGNLMIVPSLLIGVLLGYACDSFGVFSVDKLKD